MRVLSPSVSRRFRVRAVPFVAPIILAVSLLVGPAFALSPAYPLNQYVHDIWGKSAGLPQTDITSVVQTTDGYLWFGTEEGLARFDGLRMVVFDASTSPEFGANEVRKLLADPAGGLWVGTSERLVRLVGGRSVDMTPRLGRTNVSVRSLAFAPDGALWVMSDTGLQRLPSGTNARPTSIEGLPNVRRTALLVDGAASAWIGTMEGLVRVDAGRVRVLTTQEGLPHNDVTALLPAENGGLWVGTSAGLAVIRGDRVERPPGQGVLQKAWVRALIRDEQQAVWAGTSEGLVRLQGSRVEVMTSKEGLSDNTVRSLLIDREGSLWVGTMYGGVTRLRNPSVVLLERSDGFAGENTACVFEASDKSLWVGFVDNGLDHVTGGRVEHYSMREGLPSDSIRSLAQAPDGAVWVGTTAGIARQTGARFAEPQFPGGPPRGSVPAMAFGADQSLWVGTQQGVSRLAKGEWTHFTSRDGLPAQPVWTLLPSRSGHLWIGTDGGGLVRYDGRRFEVFDAAKGLAGMQVMDLHEDLRGTLWIGTDHGLSRFRDGTIRTINRRQGLLSDTVFRILDDGEGGAWMSSNVGIARAAWTDLNDVADGKSEKVDVFVLDSDDAAQPLECNGAVQPAGWRASDGRLLFSATAGVAAIDPHRLWRNETPPTVVIEEFWRGETLHREPSAPLVLPAGREEIRLRFTAPTFVRSAQTRFLYQIEGFDDTWQNAGTRREITFVNLPPGRFTFRVKAIHADGVASLSPAAIEFVKRPHYYQTAWFGVLCLAAVVAVVFGSVRWRFQRHARRERELRQRVDEAVAQIRVLQGLLPICAWCKRIRDEKGGWEQMEVYIGKHTSASFTHGICPDCEARIDNPKGG